MRKFAVRFCAVVLLFLGCVGVPPSLLAQSSPESTSSDTVNSYLDQSLDTPLAQGDDEETAAFQGDFTNDASGSSVTWFFLKIGFGLGVVIAGIWFVSKLLQKSGVAGTNSDLMGVRATLPLGQNQYLQIVQVGSQYFMLGVTDNGVNMLDELTDADTIRAVRQEDEREDDGSSGGFGDVIRSVIGTDDHSFNQTNNNDYLEELHQKINRIGDEGETQS